MDWGNIAFDWNRARAVLVTAELGSLSAAARALGLTQPTLGRQVSAFEAETGVTVFTRAGKRMDLTPTGLHLIDALRDMGRAANAVGLAAAGQSQEVAGVVTVTASGLYACHLLPPVVERLRAEAPALHLEIVATNAVRDLMRREADIAIRHVRPDQPDLTARLIGEDEATLYATPACLAQAQQLEELPFIGFDRSDALRSLIAERGVALKPENFVVIADDSHAQLELCRAGIGLAVLPAWVGDPDPGLVRALPGSDPLLRYPVWLAAHREVHNARRVRLVFDRLAEALRPALKMTPANEFAGAET